MIDLNEFATLVIDNNRNKGFHPICQIMKYELKKRSMYKYMAMKIALIHSEASKMLEALRKDDFENLIEEGIDVLIRTMEFLGCLNNVNIEKELLKKHEINLKRKEKHGGKLF